MNITWMLISIPFKFRLAVQLDNVPSLFSLLHFSASKQKQNYYLNIILVQYFGPVSTAFFK